VLLSPSAALRPALSGPLQRIWVPRDLTPLTTYAGTEVEPAAVGMTAAGVERIWSSVEQLFRSGVYPAITVCVRRHGQIVLDRAIGWSRGVGPAEARDAERVLATPGTPSCLFSASKAVTATVIHLLSERGLLYIGDRVADYLPEFGIPGFDKITIDHLLSHRAGIPIIPRELVSLDTLTDPGALRSALTSLTLRSRPGSQLAYHAASGGLVLGEVVRAATGRDLRAVLAEQILEPLGFRWTNYGVERSDQKLVAHDHLTGLRMPPPFSTRLTTALGMTPSELTRLSRDPRWLDAIVPSANVISTANEMSRFMDLLRGGGTMDGVTVLQPRTIRRAAAEQSYHEIDRTIGLPIRYSRGYMLGANAMSVFGPDTDDAFGHLGFTNVLAWADPRRELAVGLLTTGKPIFGPHLAALWTFTRRVGQAAPKVDDPVLLRG
jgi:CubicO group peptidase (beta-lactamase class C family)